MQNYINVMIADEYSANQDLQKAVALYNRSLTAYERECWTPLARYIQERLSMLEVTKKISSI